ncbi:MAG TPA: HAD family phosphatase [Terriglobales bacterium]|nr:HAD family phosphatase [Terriglobales bacterium]
MAADLPRIRAVIFDYGNVLCFPQSEADARRMAEICGMSLARFSELYWRSRLAYDRADLDRETYWAGVAREDGRTFTPGQVDQLVEIDCTGWAHINPASMQWVQQLRRAGLQLVLLSNMPAEISRYLLTHHEWPSLFHHLVFSCDLRRVKPEPESYQVCLEKLQLAPHEVLFLDDREQNVQGAAKLGMHALVFDDLSRVLEKVARRYHLPVPDAVASSAMPAEPLLDEP